MLLDGWCACVPHRPRLKLNGRQLHTGSTEGAVRLQDGADDASGRVEICARGQWGRWAVRLRPWAQHGARHSQHAAHERPCHLLLEPAFEPLSNARPVVAAHCEHAACAKTGGTILTRGWCAGSWGTCQEPPRGGRWVAARRRPGPPACRCGWRRCVRARARALTRTYGARGLTSRFAACVAGSVSVCACVSCHLLPHVHGGIRSGRASHTHQIPDGLLRASGRTAAGGMHRRRGAAGGLRHRGACGRGRVLAQSGRRRGVRHGAAAGAGRGAHRLGIL